LQIGGKNRGDNQMFLMPTQKFEKLVLRLPLHVMIMNKSEFLNQSHERMVAQAIQQAGKELREAKKQELNGKKSNTEKGFENIEKRLDALEKQS
jgi:hypothetical protein